VRIASRDWAKFEILRSSICAGREMPWVVLSKKD
jgi:hypothetical protein